MLSVVTNRGRTPEEVASAGDWMSVAVVIAAIPVVGHLLAFIYEVGFTREFGIPVQLITVSLTTVFVAVGGLFSIAFSVFALANTTSVFVPALPTGLRSKVMRAIPLAALLATFVFLFGARWREWIPLAIAFGILTALDFLLPLLTMRSRTSYLDRLAADEVAEEPLRARALISRLGSRIGVTPVTLMIWIVFAGAASHAAGRSAALHQEEFLLVGRSPEMTVLRIYGDSLIAAPVDRVTKTVKRTFVILKLDADASRPLRLEKVGPLRAEP